MLNPVLLIALIVGLVWGVMPSAEKPAESPLRPSQEIAPTLPAQEEAQTQANAASSPSLEGCHYYLLQPGLTCRSLTPERTRIQTWKNHLEFKAGGVLVWQTLCNDNPVVHEFNATEFAISADLSTVTFAGATYHYAATPPALCAGGLWCPVP